MKKKLFPSFILLVLFGLTSATVRAEIIDSTFASVNVTTSGTLSTLLKEQGYDLTKIQRVVVTGSPNVADFKVLNEEMTQLTSIDLSGATTVSMPPSAFQGKVNLISFKCPAGLTSISSKNFAGCLSLKEITFGNHITMIGSRAFENCTSLSGSIKLPSTLTLLFSYAFSGCSGLDSVDFSKCTKLTSIPKNSFQNCTDLTSVFFNPEIKTIGDSICYNCTQLKSIKVYAKTAPTLTQKSLEGVDLSSCELIVPMGLTSTYSTAPYWSSFTTIKEMGVKVNYGTNGTVTLNGDTLENGQVAFYDEAAVDLKVLPDAGYEIASFTVNGQNTPITDNSFQLAEGTLSATIGVTFKKQVYSLQVTVKGEGSLKHNTVLYRDTTFTLTAESATTFLFSLLPASGYVVDSLYFNNQSSVAQKDNTLYATPPLSCPSELTLKFSPIETLGTFYKTDVITGNNGSVEYLNIPLLKDVTDVLIRSGDAPTFSLKPSKGYIVDKVSYNEVDITSTVKNNQFTLNSITAPGNITATFRADTIVNLHVNTAGTLSTLLSTEQKNKLTNLTLSGNLDASDFYFMRDNLASLSVLDLRQATIGYYFDSQFTNTHGIPGNAFYKYEEDGNTTLTEVYLPLNTQFINDQAFANCSNLTNAHLELCTSLQTISNEAFMGTSLKTVTLPNMLNELGFSVFYKCQQLESVDLSRTRLTAVSDGCYSDCSSLHTVKLPANVETIGTFAFGNCSSLISIDLSTATKLTAINDEAFYGTALKSATLPASLTTIGNGAFQFCSALTSVDFSACTKMLKLNDYSFNHSAINKVSFPPNLKTIGMYAFESCNFIGKLELPASLTSIGENAFFNNNKLIFCKTDATTPPVLQNVVFPVSMVTVFVQKQCISTYQEASGWEEYYIISDETSITVNVSTPGTLASSINEQTDVAPGLVMNMVVTGDLNANDFEVMRTNMPLLYNLDMSGTDIVTIPEGAFKDKFVLVNFKAPKQLVEIKPNAFENCVNLKDTLIIPDSVTIIGSSAFLNCTSLTGIQLSQQLTTIGDHAFEGCNGINQPLHFSSTIKHIGNYAFTGCSSLTDTLTLPNSLETLGNYAFANCSNLTHLDLTNCTSIQSIPSYAFSGCSSLLNVGLSDTVTTISGNAFSNCIGLQTINFPTNLVSIGDNAFNGCSSLIGIDQSKCKQLKSIGEGAFMSCSGLKTVNLSPDLMTIGSEAFGYNTALKNISTMNETPATLGTNVFYKVRTMRCVLSIPKNAYNDYLNRPQWGSFVNMSKIIDVVVSTGGTIAFSSLDSIQGDNNPQLAPRKASSTGSRVESRIQSNPVSINDRAAALVENGARLCVLDNQALKFYITPDDHSHIERVVYNNIDVTDQVVNGVFTTPSVSATMGSLEVLFADGIVGIEQPERETVKSTTIYSSNGSLFIENEKEIQQVLVSDLKGTLIFRTNEQKAQHQLNNLSKGIYIVRVLLKSGNVENVKIVVN